MTVDHEGPGSAAERIYGVLLLAYLRRFRARFEAGMREAFAVKSFITIDWRNASRSLRATPVGNGAAGTLL